MGNVLMFVRKSASTDTDALIPRLLLPFSPKIFPKAFGNEVGQTQPDGRTKHKKKNRKKRKFRRELFETIRLNSTRYRSFFTGFY